MLSELVEGHLDGIGMLKKTKRCIFVIVTTRWMLKRYTEFFVAVNGRPLLDIEVAKVLELATKNDSRGSLYTIFDEFKRYCQAVCPAAW